MSDSLKDQVIEVMERLGITGHQLQSITLGPGVVGRNSSIAFALLVVMLAGVICGALLHSELLVGLSLGGAIVVPLVITCLNVHFGQKNAAAAILEGAQFIEYQHMQLTAIKGEPPTLQSGPPGPPPSRLSGGDRSSLPETRE
ncbi:MAG TPA: hypothetical protein VN950_19005 [Terriglobales bacterium]|nr:hypothetical protein [Terriglobales bacterium]